MSHFFLEIANRKLGPYQAIMRPNRDTEGDIRPILYDTADITLFDEKASFSLCYKESTNLSGKKIAFVDVVNMADGTFFSLQVSNIYYFGVFDGIPHIIAKVGQELIYFENFGKKEHPIEPDGDKHDLTPLGAFDMFLTYDDDFYYPLIFSRERKALAKVHKFYDYYGFMSYTDVNGGKHFVIFVEDVSSTEKKPVWYFLDNFVIISENIDLPWDQYVEEWKLDSYGNILFEITNGKRYHIDRDSGKMILGWDNLPTSTNFTFLRVYDDTDADEVVAKNEKWYFIIDRNKNNISDSEKEKIVYFKDFIWCLSPSEASRAFPCFLMQKSDGQIVLVNHRSEMLCGTDLTLEDEILSANIHDDILEIILKNLEKREYILENSWKY